MICRYYELMAQLEKDLVAIKGEEEQMFMNVSSTFDETQRSVVVVGCI